MQNQPTTVITYIYLRSLFGFFILNWWGLKISLQCRKQKGFVQMKNTGFGYHHYTMSTWETAEDSRNFARSGAHLQAMKLSAKLSREIRILHLEGPNLPSWSEAKGRVRTEGRAFHYQ